MGEKLIPRRGIAGTVDSVRAEYDKLRYKAYPGGGKWCAPAHLVAQPMTHGVATPSRFQIRASFVSGRSATQKIQSPFFLTFPTICSRSSIIRQQCRWPTRAGSLRSEPLPTSPFFSTRFLFIIATRATFLTRWSNTERIYTANWKDSGLSLLRIRLDSHLFLYFYLRVLS